MFVLQNLPTYVPNKIRISCVLTTKEHLRKYCNCFL